MCILCQAFASEMCRLATLRADGLKGFGGADWAKRLLTDGLHFTEAGQERVHHIIEDVVRNWKQKKEENVGERGEVVPPAGEKAVSDTEEAVSDRGEGSDRLAHAGIGGSSLRAHPAVMPWDAPSHDELVGLNNTDEWHPGGVGMVEG